METYSNETPTLLLSVQATRQNRVCFSPSMLRRKTCGKPKVLPTLRPAPRGDRSCTVQGSSWPEAPYLMTPRLRAAVRGSCLRSNIGWLLSLSSLRRPICDAALLHVLVRRSRQHVGSRLLARVTEKGIALHGANNRMQRDGDVYHLGPALGTDRYVTGHSGSGHATSAVKNPDFRRFKLSHKD